MCVSENTPRQQNSLILLQLFHEGRVWFGDGTSLFHIVKGSVQIPAVLLHSIGDDGGGRATHAHLTVNQTLGAGFPGGQMGKEASLEQILSDTKDNFRSLSVQTPTWLW